MLQRETFALTHVEPFPKSVLCIDETPSMLLICRSILEANGYRVFTASAARAGLEILEHNPIDAAVIGDDLRDMSARDLIRNLRNICKALPIVVFTSSSFPDGGFGETEIYLDKARGPMALLAAVRKMCAPEAGFQA